MLGSVYIDCMMLQSRIPLDGSVGLHRLHENMDLSSGWLTGCATPLGVF